MPTAGSEGNPQRLKLTEKMYIDSRAKKKIGVEKPMKETAVMT
jgi:hypothetical protein